MSTSPPSAKVLRQFRIVFNAVKSHFQQVEKQAGVGGAQVWALSVVVETPGIGVSALAQAMDIHQSTASNLVKALMGRGLLVSTRDAQDRRVMHLHVTDAGRAVLESAPGPWAGVLPDALARLDEATLWRLQQDLDALIRELGPDADASSGKTPLAQM